MKKTIKLPTILGVIFLVIGLVAGLFLINKTHVFRIGANTAALPKNIRFTNLTDSSLTVTWTTEIESSGYVKWGLKENKLDKIASEELSDKGFVHSVNLTDLNKDTNIYLKINSNGVDYDNNGAILQAKTNSTKVISNETKLASGTILINDGSKPAKAIVYLTINGYILSNLTSSEGSFVVPISEYIDSVTDTTIIEISANDGLSSNSQAVAFAKTVKSLPTMVLGKTYDFRSMQTVTDSESPKSSLSIPESIELSSRFEVEKSGVQIDSKTVGLESIKDGEIISTIDPEFFGTAPKNIDLKIQVESELQEELIKTKSDGTWKWNPPNDLEPGEHKITISWNDASGMLRTLTRTFIVSASEGPAFESTPSATPISPTETVRPTSSPIITANPTVIATAVPVPETGSLTPTIGLFIMGIGVLMSSFFVYKKSNA